MKKIVIGIDISKEKLDATAVFAENDGFVIAGYEIFQNQTKGFREMVKWAKHLTKYITAEDILFCCETTGGYDSKMCIFLYEKGFDVWKESALQIKLSTGVHKGKNDKADSRMIAEYAMRNQDKMTLFVPRSQNVEDLRTLFLYRRKLEQMRTSLLVRANELKHNSQKSRIASFQYRDAMKHIKDIDKSIKECEERMKELVKGDEELKRNFDHVMSVKGIGIVNAVALLVYTNNFKSFKTARQLASYYGIAAFREQSGSSINKKAYVNNLSNIMLKAYLSQAALCAVHCNCPFRDYYQRLIVKGKPHGVALNNVKNKMLHIIFSLVKNDCDYEVNHELVRTVPDSKTA